MADAAANDFTPDLSVDDGDLTVWRLTNPLKSHSHERTLYFLAVYGSLADRADSAAAGQTDRALPRRADCLELLAWMDGRGLVSRPCLRLWTESSCLGRDTARPTSRVTERRACECASGRRLRGARRVRAVRWIGIDDVLELRRPRKLVRRAADSYRIAATAPMHVLHEQRAHPVSLLWWVWKSRSIALTQEAR